MYVQIGYVTNTENSTPIISQTESRLLQTLDLPWARSQTPSSSLMSIVVNFTPFKQ